jgi:predicted nucleic acid-binding Zn ribbon protein
MKYALPVLFLNFKECFMKAKHTARKRYEGKGQIPKGLVSFLQALNSLRGEQEALDIHSVTPSELVNWLDKRKQLKIYLEKQEKASCPPTFKEEILNKRILANYMIFMEEANILFDIIENAGESPAWIGRYPTTYSKDEEGLLAVSVDGILRTLLNTEIDRLRECPVCASVFWASRLDQKGCTLRCGDILRKRRARQLLAENPAKYANNRTKKEKVGKTR